MIARCEKERRDGGVQTDICLNTLSFDFEVGTNVSCEESTVSPSMELIFVDYF